VPRKNSDTVDLVPKLREAGGAGKKSNLASSAGPALSILGNNYDLLPFSDDGDSEEEDRYTYIRNKL